ncbi:hypothetical protein CMI48_01785 [Candidatus Pacearchaeota archaeon]|nr:hypothetical protein [Candidatus Pacearchaeota archaeon]
MNQRDVDTSKMSYLEFREFARKYEGGETEDPGSHESSEGELRADPPRLSTKDGKYFPDPFGSSPFLSGTILRES